LRLAEQLLIRAEAQANNVGGEIQGVVNDHNMIHDPIFKNAERKTPQLAGLTQVQAFHVNRLFKPAPFK
jgi:hypothetical protein